MTFLGTSTETLRLSNAYIGISHEPTKCANSMSNSGLIQTIVNITDPTAFTYGILLIYLMSERLTDLDTCMEDFDRAFSS